MVGTHSVSEVTYQTVKLGQGKHMSPRHGACVMELASMIAGEPFSDHPLSVSPSIGSLLRVYNDALDDERRQDLYDYAGRSVGTTANAAIERRRIERIIEWGDEAWSRRSTGFLRQCRRRKARNHDPSTAARYAMQAMGRISDEKHAAVLALVDELIDMTAPMTETRPSAEPVTALSVH